MEILEIIRNYWALITFTITEIGVLIAFVKSINEGIKCSLRNDILDIYDKCKFDKKITKYQLEAILMTYEQYHKLKGNSFVEFIIEEVKEFEVIN